MTDREPRDPPWDDPVFAETAATYEFSKIAKFPAFMVAMAFRNNWGGEIPSPDLDFLQKMNPKETDLIGAIEVMRMRMSKIPEAQTKGKGKATGEAAPWRGYDSSRMKAVLERAQDEQMAQLKYSEKLELLHDMLEEAALYMHSADHGGMI